jgi:hypothetical protein
MKCTKNRWGTGICPPPKDSVSKEMEEKLKKMNDERAKQDMLFGPSAIPNNNTETGK